MKNHYLSLLSVSALAIAVMASAAAEVEAQCSKGCFGYPTPNQTVTRSYVPTVQYQVLPSQTFVQPIVFAAPEYLPVQNYSPVQPQVFESTPQFVPSAPIVQPMPIANVPEQRTGSSLPAEVYIPPTEVVEPDISIESGSVTPLEIPVPPVVDPVGEMKKVQEGEIEKAVMEKAAMEKAEMEKAAMEKAEMEKAEMEKAEMEKAEMEKATERKAAKEKAGKKVLTKQERIAKLEVSLQRQIQRAQQKSEKQLRKQLKGLKTDGDVSKEKINSLKQEAADALKVKLAEIEKRVQARIDQLEE